MNEHDESEETVEHVHVDDVEEATAEEEQAQQSDDVRVKIRIGAAVNGYKRGDEIVVDRTHPFFGSLIDQGIAEVID